MNTPTMQETIIFLDYSKDEYAQLIQGMYSNRSSILFAAGVSDLFRLLSKVQEPLIVVAFPANASYEQHLSPLLKAPVLVKFPFVFIGKGMQREEARIGKVLENSITLNAPTTAADVNGALSYLRDQRHPLIAKKPEPEGVVSGAQSKIPTLRETVTLSVPELCFKSLEKRGLQKVQMGCVPLVRNAQIEDFKNLDFIPADQRIRRIIDLIVPQLGRKGAGHLYRTASISNRILEKLDVEGTEIQTARNAAMLYSWSFIEKPSLLIKDYLMPNRAHLRREVAQFISSSANRIESELGLGSERAIVNSMSRLLGDEYQVSDRVEDLISSTIITTDMVNRACWQNGHWNPRAVNHLMHHFSAAEVPDIHPVVLGLTLKILSEALEGIGANLLTAQALKRNPKLTIVPPVNFAESPSTTEEATPLSMLVPGMRTSRPVFTFDGRTILNRNTVLDEDLIWRLWQLAAMRPVSSICTVRE